jgi:ABC-type bacteriocin/lantibiotic exporter with double-glycine peptidase domain
MTGVYGTAENDLRQRVLKARLGDRTHQQRHTVGTILSITTSDTYRVAGVTWSVVQQGATLAGIATATIVLFSISPILACIVIAGTFLTLLLMRVASRPLEGRGAREQAATARASSVATDLMAGLRIIQGIRAQPQAVAAYRTASAESRTGSLAAARALLLYEGLSTLIATTLLAVLALCAAFFAIRGDISIGQLVATVGLAQYLFGSLAHVGTFASNWMHKKASAQRIDRYLATLSSPDAGLTTPHHSFERTATSLTITVPLSGTPHQFTIPRGQTSALVPVTPEQGQEISRAFSVSDAPSAQNTTALRPIPHDIVFSGTLSNNLFTTPDPNLAQMTALDEVLDRVGGWGTTVGENGRLLSGGQRQRLLLTRALHAPHDLIVLHEPTTAIDPLTEEHIAAGLATSGKTILLITTSPLLLQNCATVHRLPADFRPDGTPSVETTE